MEEKHPLFLFWITFLDEYQSEVACVPKSNRVLEKEPFRLYSEPSVSLDYRHESGEMMGLAYDRFEWQTASYAK